MFLLINVSYKLTFNSNEVTDFAQRKAFDETVISTLSIIA